MSKFTVWVPERRFYAYNVECEKKEDAKDTLLKMIEDDVIQWEDWNDDWWDESITMSDWEVEERDNEN